MTVSEVQRQQYLREATSLNEGERLKIAEYSEWLPEVIIDAHAHAGLPEHVKSVPPKAYTHMMSTFPSYSLEESKRVHGLLHPDQRIRSLRFAKTFRGISHAAVNEYLLENRSEDDLVALYGLPDDVPYTVDMLADPRVSGLKMYYSYLEPTATRIYEIFKPEILEAAQANGVPIILHTPKVIPESLDDVLGMTADILELKVSIAHLGSSKFDLAELQDAYAALAEQTNVMMDTALNPSAEVCYRAITTFGSDRIMYGTDEPLNLLRSVPYIHPERGQRIVTDYLYHWQDPAEHAEYRHLARGSVHAHWLCLDALKAAIGRLSSEHEQGLAKQRIFHDNAAQFFGF